MLCQNCLKRPAYFHSPKIINNEIVQIHLCSDCAKKNESHELSNGLDDKIQFLLEGLLSSNKEKSSSSQRLTCNTCGTSVKDIRKRKLLGCSSCYDVFHKYLSEELNTNNIQFSKASIKNEFTDQIKGMKKELKKAVEAEDFEKAALLRDKIRRFEKERFFREY